jgi:hypothetical protein
MTPNRSQSPQPQKGLSTLIPAVLSRLLPTPDSDHEKGPNLWQWIKIYLDSDEQTRERLIESAEAEAKRKRKRGG